MTTTSDYSAKVIADSISDEGHRLITVEATYPRFVHSELMTHRWFSRNAASSRAIPVRKSIDRVRMFPAYPVHWGQEQTGMQSGDTLEGQQLEAAQQLWASAREWCVVRAEDLVKVGLHKSLVNRIIEPWSWITTIISSTDWENFFTQRANSRTSLAQPELARIADLIEEAIEKSYAAPLADGYGWHLPYIDDDDHEAAVKIGCNDQETVVDLLCKVAVARCARVSLLNHDGTRELLADVGLYDKLVSATPMHASPLEHVATPDPFNVHRVPVTDFRWSRREVVGMRTLPKLGNFTGYAQLRHMVEETRN